MSEPLFPRSVVEDFAREGFAIGWNDALDAARDAVAALPLEDKHGGLIGPEVRSAALAAIDALRGDQ